MKRGLCQVRRSLAKALPSGRADAVLVLFAAVVLLTIVPLGLLMLLRSIAGGPRRDGRG